MDIHAKFDKNLARYLGRNPDSGADFLILGSSGVSSGYMRIGREVSHGEFILEWERRIVPTLKALNFEVGGHYAVLHPNHIQIGGLEIALKAFRELAAAVETPAYESSEHFMTHFSESFFDYLKTLPQSRSLNSSATKRHIYVCNYFWGVGYFVEDSFKKLSHSEFLAKFIAPRVRKPVDVGDFTINDNGICGKNYKISFEEFEKLNAAVKEFYK